jgi:molecular chaperone Hsp33
LLRLDTVSTRALSAHPLPEAGQRVLAEALAVSALLGSSLKMEGRLSVQIKGDGPMNMLVTDYFAGGGLRGYARVREQKFDAAGRPSEFRKLAGEGALAITIEPKKGAQPYQGLVPLSPDGVAACAENYFAQSEQLATILRVAAAPIYRAGLGHGWRAGALMVQAVPGPHAEDIRRTDRWQKVMLFMQTLSDIELLDTEVAAETVLWRLFHEEEVRLRSSLPLRFQCTCEPERICSVLKSYPVEELRGLPDPDGIIRTRCEFCGSVYEFPLDSLERPT